MRPRKLKILLHTLATPTMLALVILAASMLFAIYQVNTITQQLQTDISSVMRHSVAKNQAYVALEMLTGAAAPKNALPPEEWRRTMMALRDSELNQHYKQKYAAVLQSSSAMDEIAKAEKAIVSGHPEQAKAESVAWLMGLIREEDTIQHAARSDAALKTFHSLALLLAVVGPLMAIAMYLLGLGAARSRRTPKKPDLDPDKARAAAAV